MKDPTQLYNFNYFINTKIIIVYNDVLQSMKQF
jgi:hypothetical protein